MTFAGSDLRRRSVAVAQLSGTMMSGEPPAARRARTWAEIRDRPRMSARHSAYAHPDQGKLATKRWAGDAFPVTGSCTAAVIPAQSTSIGLPGSRAMRAARPWVPAQLPTFLQNRGYR